MPHKRSPFREKSPDPLKLDPTLSLTDAWVMADDYNRKTAMRVVEGMEGNGVAASAKIFIPDTSRKPLVAVIKRLHPTPQEFLEVSTSLAELRNMVENLFQKQTPGACFSPQLPGTWWSQPRTPDKMVEYIKEKRDAETEYQPMHRKAAC